MSTLDELEQQFWLGNRLASKLWREIGPQLRREGWTWAQFLRLLRLNRDKIVLYMMGTLPWEDFKNDLLGSAMFFEDLRRRA